MWVVPILLHAISGGVTVHGDSSCPRPQEVSERLEEVLPSSTAADLGASIERTGDGLIVRLMDSQGKVVGEGTLPLSDACSELAMASAVMIAAWHGRLAVPSSVPQLPPKEPKIDAVAPPKVTTDERLGYDIRAAPTLFLGAGGAAVGASLTCGVGVVGSPWAAEVGLLAQTPRALNVGSGAGEWHRLTFHVGPRWSVLRETVTRLEVGVQAAGALLSIRGRGFEVNEQRRTAQVGVGATGTLSYPAWTLHPFITAGSVYWPGSQRLRAEGVEDTAMVPSFDARLALGIRWGST